MAFPQPNALVTRGLRIAGLHDHLLPIFDIVQEALAAVLPPPAHS